MTKGAPPPLALPLRLGEHDALPRRQVGLRVEAAEELYQLADQPGPAGLVAGAEPGAAVASYNFV